MNTAAITVNSVVLRRFFIFWVEVKICCDMDFYLLIGR